MKWTYSRNLHKASIIKRNPWWLTVQLAWFGNFIIKYSFILRNTIDYYKLTVKIMFCDKKLYGIEPYNERKKSLFNVE